MKTEYSVECEVCGSYNISPVKCEDCWKKEQRVEFLEFLKWTQERPMIIVREGIKKKIAELENREEKQ